MSASKNFLVREIFEPCRGKSVYTKAYGEAHPGKYPVYSASLAAPLSYIDTYDFDGTYLTWTTNGYGGRIQAIAGKFSVNGDRGVLKPLKKNLPLQYIKHILEPLLVEAAVGRRVDGRKNDYTKVSPETAGEVVVTLPTTADGEPDVDAMAKAAATLATIEKLQSSLKKQGDQIGDAEVSLALPDNCLTISLGDKKFFTLEIGERLLRKDSLKSGVPSYSANPLKPLGYVAKSSLTSFERDSIIWGIDGNFDWNLIPKGVEFDITDHCGRLQINVPDLDPEYVFHVLQATRLRYGFDRVFRASLGNVRALVTVSVPADASGQPDLAAQRLLATRYRKLASLKADTVKVLSSLAKAKPQIAA
jgi:restriction endonuclease S subunit